MVRVTVVTLLTLAISAGSAFSQATVSASAFEVASVKVAGPRAPGPGGPRGGPGTNDPTRFTYPNANLQTLMMRAYGLGSDQVSGPDWIKDYDDRTMFTVTAVVPPDTSKEQFNVMFQNLLAERFHLTVHHETKEYPGYDLVVAEGGPKIKEYVPGAGPSGPGLDANGFPRLGPNASVAFSMPRAGSGWTMLRSTYRMPMSQFCIGLGAAINENNGVEMGANKPRVTDKTGLTGTYEFTLEFAGMLIMPNLPPPPGGAPDAPLHVASDPGEVGPSLFNSLEKQLGLKLIKAKNVPVDILVIDHADKTPTDN